MLRNRLESLDWKEAHPAAVAVVSRQLVRHSPYTFDRLLASQIETRLALVQRVAERSTELDALGLLYTGSREELEEECSVMAKIHRHETRRSTDVSA